MSQPKQPPRSAEWWTSFWRGIEEANATREQPPPEPEEHEVDHDEPPAWWWSR